MDVQIESHTQLLSRLQLAINGKSCLCFLHGDSGVGKSHVVNNFVEQSATSHCIKLVYRNGTEVDKFTQQIICELASDEFLDLNQPLIDSLRQYISNQQRAVTLVVDNASQLPQPILAMLWHAVNDYARGQTNQANFSVVVVGESNWALPLFSALDKKIGSLVAEFQLKALDREQARDFMMSVHAQWSDARIEQFLKKLAPKHRLPKQLIYAQSDLSDDRGKKRLLWILSSVLFVGFAGLALAAYFLPQLQASDSSNLIESVGSEVISVDKQSASSGDTQVTALALAINKPVEKVQEDVKLEAFEQSTAEDTLASSLPNEEQMIETTREPAMISQQEPSTLGLIELPNAVSNDQAVIENDETAVEIEEAVVADTVLVQPIEPDQTINSQPSTLSYDAQQLLDESSTSYSLMLGGYSSEKLLHDIYSSLTIKSDIYQYQTIRNGNKWYVLLYGSFATMDAANKVRFALPEHLLGFSPWPKPLTSIHREITAVAVPTTENNLINE